MSSSSSTHGSSTVPLAKLKPLWGYLTRYPKRLATVLIALCISSITTLTIGPGVAYMINSGLFTIDVASPSYMIFAILGISTLLALSTAIRYYNISWIGERVVADLRKDVFEHVVDLEPEFFESTSGVDIESRFTNDMQLVQTIAGATISLALRNGVMVFGGVLAMAYMNAELTFYTLSCMFLVVAPMMFFVKRIRARTKKAQEKVADVGANMHEVAMNIKTVQGFNRQAYHSDKFTQSVETAFETGRFAIIARALMIASSIAVITLTMTLLISYGMWSIESGLMTKGDLIGFLFLSFLVTGSGTMLVESIAEFMRAAGAMDRLMGLLTLDKVTVSSLMAADRAEMIDEKTLESKEFNGELQISNLSFSYSSRPDIKVLEQASLTFPAGSHSVIMGSSGSGKSTLFDLILRFYNYEQGAVLIDGLDIRKLPLDRLRTLIGLVRQESPILEGTIRENILYGKPDAIEPELNEAIAATQLEEFIIRLPQGIDTKVGPNGVALSGGQKQRISLARTLIAKPAVLLLDEVTSGLDVQTAAKIQEVIKNLSKHTTIIESAHRLRNLDRETVILMEAGKVIAKGTHTELMASSEQYRDLQTQQQDQQVN